MSSVKAKNYGSGPRGYFQRVLSDGARPFQYQAQTSRLLGSQGMSVVKPIGARKISSLSFHYQHRLGARDGLNPISTSEQAIESSGIGDSKINPVITENNVTESQKVRNIKSDNKTNLENRVLIQNTNDNMTLLSWLEKMQVRQPLHTDENPLEDAVQADTGLAVEQANSGDIKASSSVESVALAPSHELTARARPSLSTPPQKNRAIHPEATKEVTQQTFTQQQSTSPNRVIQTDSVRKSVSNKTLPLDTSAQPTAVLSDPALALKNKDSIVSQNIRLPVAQAKGINLPDGPRPTVSLIKPGDASSLSENKPALIATTRQTQQIKKVSRERIQKPGPVVYENRENVNLSSQQRPQSLPLSKPDHQGMSIAKLKQALRTSLRAVSFISRSTSSPESKESSTAHKKQPAQPQPQQQVTIVNPPARPNYTAAFWERSHMSRFGPRSYK